MTAPELTNQAADTRFGALLQQSLQNGSLVRITLGAPLGTDRTLRNLLIRPVLLKQGPRLSFVWRHATQDITKNFAHDEGLRRILAALGTEFRTRRRGWCAAPRIGKAPTLWWRIASSSPTRSWRSTSEKVFRRGVWFLRWCCCRRSLLRCGPPGAGLSTCRCYFSWWLRSHSWGRPGG